MNLWTQRLRQPYRLLREPPDLPRRRRRMEHYTWAEPGDPPNADYESVRARRLAEPMCMRISNSARRSWSLFCALPRQ